MRGVRGGAQAVTDTDYTGLRDVFEAARKAVGLREGCRYDAVVEGLDSLTAALEAAERRLQHFEECADTPLMRDVMDARDAAEARVVQLERERDAARDTATVEARLADEEHARVVQLETALTRMANRDVPKTYGGGTHAFVAYARAALAAGGEETK